MDEREFVCVNDGLMNCGTVRLSDLSGTPRWVHTGEPYAKEMKERKFCDGAAGIRERLLVANPSTMEIIHDPQCCQYWPNGHAEDYPNMSCL